MWVIVAAVGHSDVTIRFLSLFLHYLRFCLIEAVDRFDGHSEQCPRRQTPPPTPERMTPTHLELQHGTRRVSCRLLSFTRRLERPSFPPTCHKVMGLWKIWPPAAHLAHAAVLNRGQAFDALTSQRSAGKIKRWFQQTQVKSGLVIPISFLICVKDQMGWSYHRCFRIYHPFTESSNDV